MKIHNVIIGLLAVLSVSSCKIDTYLEPKETLFGSLICPDGSTLITEQPNGAKIRLTEVVDGKVDHGQNQDFWCKADGTFLNTKIFEGTYRIQPIEGAFLPVEPIEIKISGKTKLDFHVIPNLTIEAGFACKGSSIISNFKVSKAEGAGKIKTGRLLVSKWNPNVGMNNLDSEATIDFSNLSDESIVGKTFKLQIDDYIEHGATYYARIAVLSENASGRYNFSETVKLETE